MKFLTTAQRAVTNGAEDIDEFVLTIEGVTLHIEKMNDNEYSIDLDGHGKSATLFIGHWPKDRRKQGTLKLNIFENQDGGRWHY